MRETYWDPFEGTQTPALPAPEKGASKWVLPDYLKKLELPLLLLAFPAFAVAAFSDTYRFYGVAAFTIGVGGGLAINHFSDAEGTLRRRLQAAADALGFAFRGLMPDGRLGTIRRRVPELFTLRIGGSIPLVISTEMWGESPSGVPLWLGAAALQSAALFGGPKQDRSVGPETMFGNTVMMIAGYRLERDTGIRVLIMPEFVTAIGPLDRDIKTESVEFNAKFNIRMSMADGQSAVPDEATADLLRVLTPAFQATLIDLADRFAARVIVDRDTVFFAGYQNVRALDADLLTGLVRSSVDRFAEAAVSFKRYAE
ncbi:MAG: hypothetical protein AAGL24_14875 [Pseudomonadota bacterium]